MKYNNKRMSYESSKMLMKIKETMNIKHISQRRFRRLINS